VPSFGAKLKQQREQRGVTLEEISETTKIGSRFLHALENDRFDQLPGGIFNKGFIRAYAKSVGLDEEETVAGYLEATGVVPGQPDAPTPLPEIRAAAEPDGAAGLPWGALAIVLLVAALSLVVWGLFSRSVSRSAVTKSQPSPQAAAGNGDSPPPSITAPATPAATPLSQTLSSDNAQKPGEIPPGSSNRKTGDADKTGQKPVFATAQPIDLRITARADSWISISVDGEVMTRNTMSAGADKSIHAAREIVVKAGNIGALDFEFNGKKLPDQGGAGEVKTLTFDAAGIHASTSAPDSAPDQCGTPRP
jgi:cytoskeleton protein RodZ